MKHRTLDNYIDEQMKNPEFKEEWNKLDTEFALITSIVRAREAAGLTQAELAEKIARSSPHFQDSKGGIQKGYRRKRSQNSSCPQCRSRHQSQPAKKKAAVLKNVKKGLKDAAQGKTSRLKLKDL